MLVSERTALAKKPIGTLVTLDRIFELVEGNLSTEKRNDKEAVEQLVREVAFTHLNRFCAYKMMEHRGLIRKAVSDGLKSQGFLFLPS